jgi:hypothetical protein
MNRPGADEFAPFYAGYVSLVPETDVLPVLAGQAAELARLAAAVPAERETWSYQPGKWSLRQLFGHVTDAERLFGFRAFCISRGERASLPGFDENEYVAAAGYDRRPLADLAREFSMVREGNLAMLRALDAEAWERSGTANGTRVSVRALAWILAGHVRHHQRVLRERYGVG